MSDATQPGRLFIVGFPRSGTTLLQSFLAAHPDVYTLGETFFFHRLESPRNPLRRLMRRRDNDASAVISGLIQNGAIIDTQGHLDRIRRERPSQLADRFVSGLDAAAARDSKRAWLEKTPVHLHYLDQIQRFVPGAIVIHIVRDGPSAVASMYAVTAEYPDRWGSRRSLDECVKRWIDDLNVTHRRIRTPGNIFVSYERLVSEPLPVLEHLVSATNLRTSREYLESMMSRKSELGSFIADEPWKAGVTEGVADRNAAHLGTLFSPSEQEALRERLAPYAELLADIPFL